MNILLAVDRSDDSEAAAKAVATQFRPAGNAVTVLYAANWEQHLPTSYLFAEGAGAARAVVTFQEQTLRDADDYVKRIASPLRDAGFSVTARVVPEGEPRTVILDEAARWPADLIVVGSHGRSGLSRFLLGSVAEGVMRHAGCSVQVVRAARVERAREDRATAASGHGVAAGQRV